MNEIYSDLQNVAADLFAEFKQGEIAYIQIVPGTDRPDDPGEPSEVVHPIDATAQSVQFKYVDGTSILTTDEQISMPGKGVEPEMNGFVTVDGERYKIIGIKPKPAAGPVVAYAVIYRK